MSETARIADQLKRAFDGEAWHGPALLELLDGVSAESAMDRPFRDAHSIWELTAHVEAWNAAGLRSIGGEVLDVSEENNFGDAQKRSAADWEQLLSQLRQGKLALLAAIAKMPDSRLTEQVPGREYDFYFLLHGLVQHTLYHAGQIALLKKSRA